MASMLGLLDERRALKSKTGFRAAAAAVLVLGLTAASAAGTYAARGSSSDDDRDRRVAMRDDCDPRDPNWNIVGGCDRKRGNVTFAEFNAHLSSTLSPTTVVGHQAWRNDPSYLVVKHGTTLRVKNTGGREHTFTEVAEFGGGIVPPLTRGLTPAPECPLSIGVLPGDSIRVANLSVGDHLFQCCFHPWMRAMVKVKPSRGGDDDDDRDHSSHH
jgi:plastocyanin